MMNADLRQGALQAKGRHNWQTAGRRESVREMDRTYKHEGVLCTASRSDIDQNLATAVRVWIEHGPFFRGQIVCKGGNKDRTYVRISRGPNATLKCQRFPPSRSTIHTIYPGVNPREIILLLQYTNHSSSSSSKVS
ncbi:hypothetical protein FIBSPDRAFT_304995 [Athelia psychrophila]|uniref:Uncharacterized protein n=1 Tax=Athelia psychrophila TaxID=1759441 RepID=A0A167WZD0_9AGAM|nr:hypothetical protein FIBSPDRAFT_304995 [Fibularhizoctonia sp. CBS 109695]